MIIAIAIEKNISQALMLCYIEEFDDCSILTDTFHHKVETVNYILFTIKNNIE